jgi:hypothetical protein
VCSYYDIMFTFTLIYNTVPLCIQPVMLVASMNLKIGKYNYIILTAATHVKRELP